MDHVPPAHQHDAFDAHREHGADHSVEPGRGTRAALLGLALVAAALFLGLGVWQLERRAWKLALIERVDQRIHAPAGLLPPARAWPAWVAQDPSYSRVQVTGVLDHGRETLVQAVTERGPGFWVMTPLRMTQGTVLINRGFVPLDRSDPATRLAGQLAGAVTIVGLVRLSEPGGGFLRANDQARDRWYSRDVAEIARARGLAGVAPFFIDADATPNPGGYPSGGLTVVAFRNVHLVYALTWFALAGLAGAAAWRVRPAMPDPPERLPGSTQAR
jgi:surfeit locus 1 family protein